MLVKLDADGEHVLSRSIPFVHRYATIAFDAAGDMLVTSENSLSKFSANGAELWTLPIAGADIVDLAVSPLGTLAITGHADGDPALDFGAGPISLPAPLDGFVAAFTP
ncbi:hypothetical protein [Sorangium sp. So ce1153]|uniref:hypothetical protein n=1 Tax=Sorangium sp. So ce1153 TaxID=3133333 RepID=UPI003F5EFB99